MNKSLKLMMLWSGLSALVAVSSCIKDDYNDLSFVQNGKAPEDVSVHFDITQDNTGLVTITPNGQGASSYDVYFGDGTISPQNIKAGKSVQHTYAEGVYNVKVTGYSVTGEKTDATQNLTVSFKAPEQVEATVAIDADDNFKVNVVAKADYETLFNVYFGDVENENPVAMSEGETISHVYPATGTYTVRIVALSGGAATTEVTQTVTIVNPLLLPLSFESPTLAYAFGDFNGGVATVADNPSKDALNASAKVGKMVKNGGEVWGGSSIVLSNAIDFSVNKIFRMKVFSPRVGARVLLKVENVNDAGINYEKEVTTTKANEWEELGFDYSGIDVSKAYHKIVLIFDNGVMGDGSANYTFYFDDIELASSMPGAVLGLPLDFESTAVTYSFFGFDGGQAGVADNPHKSGINTSNKVAKMIKGAGASWAGSFLALDNPIDFSVNKTFSMKVYAPRAGAKVLLKVENLSDGSISYEQEKATTQSNQWEELTFDYTAIDATKSYQKITIIFDNGTGGDGSANYTFYVDDIILH